MATAPLCWPATNSCPLCGDALAPFCAVDAPGVLGGFPLLHCAACDHTCSPEAYGAPVDYEALYGAGYAEEQIAPLRDQAHYYEFCLQPVYLAFFQHCGDGRRRSLLDIGCGAGRFLIAARGRGWQVQGVEPSALANQAAQELGLPVTEQAAEDLLEQALRFNTVTLFDVIEHVGDPLELLRVAMALLKSAGDLFVTVPNWDCPLMREATRADWIPPVHLQFFSLRSLRRSVEFAAAGQMKVLGSGLVWTDPRRPFALQFEGGRHLLAKPLLRWAWHRLRQRPNWSAQLWLHARKA